MCCNVPTFWDEESLCKVALFSAINDELLNKNFQYCSFSSAFKRIDNGYLYAATETSDQQLYTRMKVEYIANEYILKVEYSNENHITRTSDWMIPCNDLKLLNPPTNTGLNFSIFDLISNFNNVQVRFGLPLQLDKFNNYLNLLLDERLPLARKMIGDCYHLPRVLVELILSYS